jgi:catecholate siderophore receptor
MRIAAFALVASCGITAGTARFAYAESSFVTDTIAPMRFEIPAQSLISALHEIGRQAGAEIEIKARVAPNAMSPAVVGYFTLPDALRRILFGSGLRAEIKPNQRVRIVPDEGEDAPVYNLRPIEVVATRNRGYSAVRTVTATKTDIPLRDAPQSVSVITKDVIADQSMQNMSDVVRFMPGVSMGQGEGHRDAPTIRGNSSTADFFVNGVRDDAQYLRDLYNVERVEALKGANALVFGRGGGGGVINRVMKEPKFAAERVLTVQGGSFENRRGTLDISQPINDEVALRFNGLYENSGGFRDNARLERVGINPSISWAIAEGTMFKASLEYFDDQRNVDRGIPSFEGKPSTAPRTTYFGNADSSYSTLNVHNAMAVLEHEFGPVTLRSQARFTQYDKFYQNSFPGAINAAGTQVALSAYANATDRSNVFNQTDLIAQLNTGTIAHTLLLGVELGRQRTANFRTTGYYNNTATSLNVDLAAPTIRTPITFRQSATDADNRAIVNVSSAYVQDQVQIATHWQAIAGLRYDRFAIDFHNNRTDADLERKDELWSPRAGLLYKPVETASFYGSYSVSHLPSAGDQFSSLTATTQTLEPEQFTNIEFGGKWDVRPNLSIAAAVYRLDRENTTAPDPTDPTKVLQTGSQRTKGFEASLAGDLTPTWHVVAAMALQSAEITSRTSAAAEGARVALVPEKTISLWNRYNFRPGVGIGLGIIHQADMFASIDNKVTLPSFTRADGALFIKVNGTFSGQVNIENLLDEHYFATSHGNNNIMPGAGRTIRVSLTTRR